MVATSVFCSPAIDFLLFRSHGNVGIEGEREFLCICVLVEEYLPMANHLTQKSKRKFKLNLTQINGLNATREKIKQNKRSKRKIRPIEMRMRKVKQKQKNVSPNHIESTSTQASVYSVLLVSSISALKLCELSTFGVIIECMHNVMKLSSIWKTPRCRSKEKNRYTLDFVVVSSILACFQNWFHFRMA